VARVKEITKVHVSSPLERLLGQQIQVLGREELQVNSFVKVEFLEIGFTEKELPEEHGRLFLFPIEDGRFSMQILYLQHNDAPSDTARICWMHFMPGFFDQYSIDSLMVNAPFRFDKSTEQQFSICTQTQSLLEQIKNTRSLTGFLQSIQQTEISLHLLRRTMENILVPFTVCQVPACRFLAYDSEREKIADARRILDTQYDQSITIKELSKKVAMNECYLKKGFKALTGRTIHEYQQELRINKAKELLKQHDHSVSDVASILGFSSISHFSTAFKKATGLKPCELLS
jgi:AraC-like DNA-binding protein